MIFVPSVHTMMVLLVITVILNVIYALDQEILIVLFVIVPTIICQAAPLA